LPFNPRNSQDKQNAKATDANIDKETKQFLRSLSVFAGISTDDKNL